MIHLGERPSACSVLESSVDGHVGEGQLPAQGRC